MKRLPKNWIRIARYAKPYWKLVVLVMILSITTSLLYLVNPYLIKIFIDDVLIPKKISLLWVLLALFLLVEVVISVLGIVFAYTQRSLKENVILGNLIPSGTGSKPYRNIAVRDLDAEIPTSVDEDSDSFSASSTTDETESMIY